MARLCAFSLPLLLLAALVACSRRDVPVTSATAADRIVLTDMLGQRLELSRRVQRVVTVPMPAGSLHMSLDHGPARLAGMHPNAHAQMRSGLLSRIYPAAQAVRADITRSGFAPNVETLLGMRPDLVWQWGHLGDELIAPLREAGLPVAALLYGEEARTVEWIRLMGQALGREAEASAQLAWRRQVRQELAHVSSTLTPAQRPRVLYLARYWPQYRAAGQGTNFDDDVTLAGGHNVAGGLHGARNVSAEQILAWAPDVIVLNTFEPDLLPRTVLDDPRLADLPAVRSRRVYKAPNGGYRWDAPNQESPLYWKWLAMQLHPRRFDWPLRAEIARAYGQLYGYAPTPADIDAVLQLDANREAAGYARFR